MKEYYLILGVPVGSSLDEIKHAYRQKAKVYHPDKNKSPEAEQKFIELTEAYKLLVASRTHAFTRSLRYSTNKQQTKEDFLKRQKAAARKRAREYADMKYEEFLRSEGHQTKEAFAVVIGHLLFFVCVAFVILLPIFLFVKVGFGGVIGSILILFILSPLFLEVFKEYYDISYRDFSEALKYLLRGYVFLIVLLACINFILVLRIGFQTLLPTTWLLWSYPILAVIVFLFQKKKKTDLKIGEKYFKATSLAPFVLNCFLLLNYFLSSGTVTETYPYSCIYENVHDKITGTVHQKTTLITLQNNKYQAYWGIRVFNSFEKIGNGRSIQYTFENGLFGARVMKDYKIK